MKCRIQWINTRGEATPDDNEAIGYAVYKSRGRYPSGADATKDDRFPICAEHLKRMPKAPMIHDDQRITWEFEPFEGQS